MPFQKRRDFLKDIINSFVAEQRAAAAGGDQAEPEPAAEPEEDAAPQEVCLVTVDSRLGLWSNVGGFCSEGVVYGLLPL